MSTNGFEKLGVLYRTPCVNTPELLTELNAYAHDGHCLVMGDFNTPNIDWESNTCNTTDHFSNELHETLMALCLV